MSVQINKFLYLSLSSCVLSPEILSAENSWPLQSLIMRTERECGWVGNRHYNYSMFHPVKRKWVHIIVNVRRFFHLKPSPSIKKIWSAICVQMLCGQTCQFCKKCNEQNHLKILPQYFLIYQDFSLNSISWEYEQKL